MRLVLRADPPLASLKIELDRPEFGRLGRRVPRAGTRPSQARLDDLTGLRNTRALTEEFEERAKAGAAGVPLAVVVVDFDRLGALNLRYNRAVGDAVVWAGAAVARDEATSPRLVFRFDDDDLVLLVPGDEEDGREVAERIRERVAAQNHDLPAVTVSCGVAAAETPARLWLALEKAGTALRTAKQAGGNRVVLGTHRNGNGNGNGNGGASGMDTALRAALALAVTTLEVRNPETADHSDDVVTLAETIGRRFGMGDYELDRLSAGAQLHDVGKLAIPTEILNKPGPLDKNEWAVIREHTVIGERILRSVPEMAEVATIVRHSHEHWDGSGYPDGLAGEEIPLASRIILCADAFHAMRSDRSYRRGRPAKDAIAELVACKGSQFDPRVVDEMIAIARAVRTDRGVARAGMRRMRRLIALLAALAVGGGSAYAASDDVRHVFDGVFDVIVPNVIAQPAGSGASGELTASPVVAVSRIVPVEFSAAADSVDPTRTGGSALRGLESESIDDDASDAPARPAPTEREPRAKAPERGEDAFEPIVPIAMPINFAPEGPAVSTPAVEVPPTLPPLVDLAPEIATTVELTPAAELAAEPDSGPPATPPALGNPHGEPPGLVKLPVLNDEPARDDKPVRDDKPERDDLHVPPPAVGNPHGEPPGLVKLPELDAPPSLEALPELEHADPPVLGNPHGGPPAVGNPHGEPPALGNPHEDLPGLSVVEGTPLLGAEEEPETPAVEADPPAVGNPHSDPPAVGNPHGDPPGLDKKDVEPLPEPEPAPVVDAVTTAPPEITPALETPVEVLSSPPIEFGPGKSHLTPAATRRASAKRSGPPWSEHATEPLENTPPAEPAP